MHEMTVSGYRTTGQHGTVTPRERNSRGDPLKAPALCLEAPSDPNAKRRSQAGSPKWEARVLLRWSEQAGPGLQEALRQLGTEDRLSESSYSEKQLRESAGRSPWACWSSHTQWHRTLYSQANNHLSGDGGWNNAQSLGSSQYPLWGSFRNTTTTC